MIVSGIYNFIKNGEEHRVRSRFESTGEKFPDGKAIWRKLKKDGGASNIFAEQFIPDVPWLAPGKWFCKVDGGQVLREFPQLKQNTEKAVELGHEEYCTLLSSSYEA